MEGTCTFTFIYLGYKFDTLYPAFLSLSGSLKYVLY